MRASLAVSGGVATPEDGIKAILAGADVVQQVSALLREGASYCATMRNGLARWLERKAIARVADARGLVSLQYHADASAFERGTYLRMLQAGGHKAVRS